MYHIIRTSTAALIIFSLFFIGSLQAKTTSNEVDWEIFSKNLVNALQSENTGLQQSAMQLVIRHGDRLQVHDALFDVVRVFRSGKDRGVRLLALTAMSKMNSNWAFYFMKRSIKFEDDPIIKRQLLAIVIDHYNRKQAKEGDLALMNWEY